MDSFRIRNFLGKVPLSRALRFTVERGHVTRLTQAEPRGFFEIPGGLAETLESQIRRGKERSPIVLGRMRELLQGLQKYAGPKPTYAEAIAALALNKGLKNRELKDYANALHSLNLRATRIGSPLLADKRYGVLSAIANNRLHSIYLTLRRSYQPIYTHEIAKANSIARQYALHALTTLEAAGLATAIQPMERKKGNTSAYRWIDAEKRNTGATNPVSSPAYGILLSLEQGEKSISQLSRPDQFGSMTIGKGQFSPKTVKSSLNNFEKMAVVAWEEKKVPGRRRPVRFFRLTDYGRTLVGRQKLRASIEPEMRLLLLGAPFRGLAPDHQRRLQAIAKYVAVRQAYEAAPRHGKMVKRGTLNELSERFNAPSPFVKHAISLQYPPWSNHSFQILSSVYLPALQTLYPEAAAWFRRYLNSNRKKFKQAKTAKKTVVERNAEDLFLNNQQIALAMARSYWSRNRDELQRRGHNLGAIEQEALLALNNAAQKTRYMQVTSFEAWCKAHIKLALKAMRRPPRHPTTSLGETTSAHAQSSQPTSNAQRRQTQPELSKLLLEAINSTGESSRNKKLFRDLSGIKVSARLSIRQAAKKYGMSATGVAKLRQRMLTKLRQNPKAKIALAWLTDK